MASLATETEAETVGSSILQDEIEKSIREGKGWKEGEREAYLKRVAEEDHPMFADVEVRRNYHEEAGCPAM